ncbi:MAG TPA: hypothetical protein VGX78_05215 [Pirellulales bacterium]|nr:hypothetical protein [Pirellulales bacterium]
MSRSLITRVGLAFCLVGIVSMAPRTLAQTRAEPSSRRSGRPGDVADPTDVGHLPGTSRYLPETWGVGPWPMKVNGSPRAKSACPLCGARHDRDTVESLDVAETQRTDTEPTDTIEPKALANYLKELLTRNVAQERPARHKLKTKEKLRPGEPAQVILELKERLGDGALEGTEFADSPDVLVKVIRALEAEQREQDESEAETPDLPLSRFSRGTTPKHSELEVADAPQPRHLAANEAAIGVLRAASRDLDLAAEALEEQELYRRADQLRALADELRRDSRVAAARWRSEGPGSIAPDHTEWRRIEPQEEARLDGSSDMAQLREELRRVRQALEEGRIQESEGRMPEEQVDRDVKGKRATAATEN